MCKNADKEHGIKKNLTLRSARNYRYQINVPWSTPFTIFEFVGIVVHPFVFDNCRCLEQSETDGGFKGRHASVHFSSPISTFTASPSSSIHTDDVEADQDGAGKKNGRATRTVMMKTTTLVVTGMAATAVEQTKIMSTVQSVNVWTVPMCPRATSASNP